MPRWFTGLFVCVMLCAVLVAGWCAVDRVLVDFQLEDTAGMLDTSRQREDKQQYEYDQAAEELPIVRAELAELAPKADAVKTEEADLRAQRKSLRADAKQLQADLDDALAALADARSRAGQSGLLLHAQLDALRPLILR